jgi:uncharacterized membrane protein YhhN
MHSRTIYKLLFFTQLSKEIRSTMPFLVPFLKMTCIHFILMLDKGSLAAAVVKCLPLLSLVWFVCLLGVSDPHTHRYNRRIVAALCWCCAGDLFLVWSEDNELYFLLGLASFAVGHFVYTLAFGWRPFGLKEFLFTFSVGIPGLAVLASCVTGVMQYLSLGYGVLILVMQWRALARFNLKGEIPWRKIYSGIGAILFVFSDYVLAVNKFCFPVPAESYVIMVSYFAAQFFIALSVVNSNFVISPTNSNNGVIASIKDEKNRNFHVNRTLSEGNLTNNSRVHGKINDDTDLKKDRNDDFHLNGTDSVQD